MAKYYVTQSFMGTVGVLVEANNEEQALEIGTRKIESMSDEEYARCMLDGADFDGFDVYEDK